MEQGRQEEVLPAERLLKKVVIELELSVITR
jgi:hypothetical protein